MSRQVERMKPFTVVVSASDLPESVLSRFPKRPPSQARFAVTVEPAESEAERLGALDRDIRAGLDDLAAGRVVDGGGVFARLKARFPGR